MNHDDVARRLQQLAGPTPLITVDRGRVLHAGRRRRTARAVALGGTATLGLTALVGGVVVALPQGGSDDPSLAAPPPSTSASATPDPTSGAVPPAPGDAPAAVVDLATGAITLPLDELTLSPRDQVVIEWARSLSVSRCMEEAGYGANHRFAPPELPADIPSSHHGINGSYGVWVREQVATYGYGGPSWHDTELWDSADRRAGGDDAAAAELACSLAAIDEGLGYSQEQFDAWDAVAPEGWQPAQYTTEGQAVLEEWRACLTAAGVTPPGPDEGMIPPGVMGAPPAEQVRVGLIDVTCKEDLDVVQRLADVDAAQQWAYLERGGREYLQERAAADRAMLATAEALLAGAGIEVPEG